MIKMKKYSLNNIKSLMIKDGNLTIEYIDGVKVLINDANEIIFSLDLRNENDQPLVNHCI
jgi:hypothetical protein